MRYFTCRIYIARPLACNGGSCDHRYSGSSARAAGATSAWLAVPTDGSFKLVSREGLIEAWPVEGWDGREMIRRDKS